MIGYIVRRLLWLVPTLWIIVTASFFFIRMAPGGPFDTDRAFPPEVERNLKIKYHLDKPLMGQYKDYMTDLLHGDLGPSLKYKGRSVNDIIAQAIPVSATLGFWALLFSLSLGLFTGVISAVKRGTWWDYSAMVGAMLGVSIPNFILGPLLIILFCFTVKWFPVAGWGKPSQIILPALTLGAIRASYVARLARSGMLDVLGMDFVRTAKAKGLGSGKIIWAHALKVGVLPVVSYLGPAVAAILVGSVVVERIFAIPGLGSFFVNAAMNRDYTLAMGEVLVYSFLLLSLNLLVDLGYAWLDPRVRLD